MIVRALITNVNTDAELTAITGLTRNDFVWHTGNSAIYIYEPTFTTGDISSVEGGYWVVDNIESLDLNAYKEVRFNEIDTRTGEKVGEGFVYQSKVFSMSYNAQTNILALDNSRNDPAISYPIGYNTIDDLDTYYVQDAVDLHNMYLTALGTKKAWVDSGTTLKDAIRACTTEQEVEAIIDNR